MLGLLNRSRIGKAVFVARIVLIVKVERKRPHGRNRLRWKDNN
jgi:hypothetical protein